MAKRPASLVAALIANTLFLTVFVAPSFGGQYNPESPKVKEMIAKALNFLETEHGEDKRFGAQCLMGLAFHKAGAEADHPRIVKAVKRCQAECQRSPSALGYNALYSIGIAAIFLAELNPTLYQKELETLTGWIADTQKPHGGWSYIEPDPKSKGDTSITQYAVLSLWTAQQAGVRVDPDMVRSVAGWLARTQTPSGQWGYQTIDPGGSNRINQRGLTYSRFAAGISSSYICADMLGLSGDMRRATTVSDLPDAFIPVDESGKSKRVANVSADLTGLLGRATNDGNAWYAANYKINTDNQGFPIYYLYAVERYMSFRELAEGGSTGHPPWYDDGVEMLATKQGSDGAWNGGCGRTPCTAFATLFLLRSTKKSIDKANYGQGLLSGGRGLPKDIANARVQRGKVVSEPLGGKATDVLAILEDPDNPQFEALVDNPGAITLSSNSATQQGESDRFKRILRSSDQPLARRLAVKALSQRRDMDNVPILIYALTDGDQLVSIGARNGLRFMSRKLDGFGMRDNPSKQDKIAATINWKDWYRSIRPDAEFIE